MTPDQFSQFRHEAVHALMRLNESCEEQFRISSFPRWDYDFEQEILTFSQDGVPKVIASIQVVGTTSKAGGTWLWGWANKNLPPNVVKAVAKVRAFGEAENLGELANASAPDDEYLGWGMTAIAAQVLGSKGAYRCPGNDGYVYLVYTDLNFASEKTQAQSDGKEIECSTHGSGFTTYVCEHLVSNPAQEWFSRDPDDDNRWPDAWCAACDGFFQEEGEWNDTNNSKLRIKLLCHHCYERLRSGH
jgi:hypothetical protein